MPNLIVLDGNLIADPDELKELEGGKAVRNFRFAHNERGRDGKERTVFISAECWDGFARNLCAKKGSGVVVTGKLLQDRWTGEDGVKRETVTIRASEVKELSPRPENSTPEPKKETA